jgi:maleylpyruvate isomerase
MPSPPPTHGIGPRIENRPASDWVWWRLREVEIHHVDLAGEYPARQWPALLIATQTPETLDTLDERIDQPIRVEIESVSIAELDGLTWTSGRPGEPTLVSGPDWAVLAWLVGRPAAAQDALPATPPLRPWK